MEAIAEKLTKALARERVSLAAADRALHARDQSFHPGRTPDIVVWPRTTAEVSAILRLADEARVPVTGWGAGSSLEGNPIPLHGGIVVNFQQMNQILAIHASDFQVTVQPGILYQDMNRILVHHGLFFAPDPGANASIGGMVANNAAGVRTVRYGATRDNVLALEVVLAGGAVVKTGSRSVKQSAGYDLTHLFVGSEGTLGLVTQVTLKLAPLPEHFSAVIASFPTVEAAAQTVFEIMGAGLAPAAMELMDALTAAILNTHGDVTLPVAPLLLMEFIGASETALREELQLVEEVCRENGLLAFGAGVGREARDRLWRVRHDHFEIARRQHPGQDYRGTDVAVPISAYPALIATATGLIEELQVNGSILGHAGDGNLHTTVFFPPEDDAALARADQLGNRLVERAIELGGTSTGEHGVGIGKQKYMVREHGRAAVDVMRLIKQTLDPHGILNPGKVLGGENRLEV